MGRIASKLKMYVLNCFNKMWFTLYTRNTIPPKLDYFQNELWIKVEKFIKENKDIKYHVTYEEFGKKGNFKWVGGVCTEKAVIGIANGSQTCLYIDLKNNTIKEIGNLSEGQFKWSGGCVYNNTVYGFPRTANTLLEYPNDGMPKELQLDICYNSEHHYGGVCTSDGMVYQPPRSTNHILKIDLNTKRVDKLVISKYKREFRYCGSIIHPNGLIYMFPEYQERVLVVDPRSDHIYFIGKTITTMVFDACIGYDGNIYGFSAYSNGILKIDVLADDAKILFKNLMFGCYGSVLGVNGNVIGIPGNGNKVYEYNIRDNNIDVIMMLEDDSLAKCAGSAVGPDGTIYCIPALGNRVYKIKPSSDINLPKDIMNSFYINGCY